MLDRLVKFDAGYDCRKFECRFDSKQCKPNLGGWHGTHGLNITFIVKGEHGATSFCIYTGWLPQYAPKQILRNIPQWSTLDVMPADLAYHSKVQSNEWEYVTEECPYCDNQKCYSSGSGLNAVDAMYALVNGGSDALYNFMEGYYNHVFSGADYPEPCEYPKPLRSRANACT